MKRLTEFCLFGLSILLLNGCLQNQSSPEDIQTLPLTPSTVSPTSTPAVALIPTESIVDPTAVSLLPQRVPINELTAVSADAIAYVQNEQLIIQKLQNGEPISMVKGDQCPITRWCVLGGLKWSPNGKFLLYYFDGSLRLTDHQGNVQIISTFEEQGVPYEGAWSPNGRSIAFIKPVGVESSHVDISHSEIWIVSVNEKGILGTSEKVGDWSAEFEYKSGPGSSPLAEHLYYREGGQVFSFILGQLLWTSENLLLYSIGQQQFEMGRFDLSQNSFLPSYEQPLHNLVLNSSGSRFYAITQINNPFLKKHILVTGTPDNLGLKIIPTSAPVYTLSMGQQSDTLFYTSRNKLGREQYDRFWFFETSLWQINSETLDDEQLFVSSAYHALAQLSETSNGDLFLVAIENERPLAAATQLGILSQEQLQAYSPQRHIVKMPSGSRELLMVFSNAGLPSLSFDQSER